MIHHRAPCFAGLLKRSWNRLAFILYILLILSNKTSVSVCVCLRLKLPSTIYNLLAIHYLCSIHHALPLTSGSWQLSCSPDISWIAVARGYSYELFKLRRLGLACIRFVCYRSTKIKYSVQRRVMTRWYLWSQDSCILVSASLLWTLCLPIYSGPVPSAHCVTLFINCIFIYTIVCADFVQNKSTCKTALFNHIALICLG